MTEFRLNAALIYTALHFTLDLFYQREGAADTFSHEWAVKKSSCMEDAGTFSLERAEKKSP